MISDCFDEERHIKEEVVTTLGSILYIFISQCQPDSFKSSHRVGTSELPLRDEARHQVVEAIACRVVDVNVNVK